MKIFTSIASTTRIDRHNERMSKEALEGIVDQVKEKYMPQLIEHDWNQQIGVVLYGEVFPLKDGEYALGIVSGIFENNDEKSKFVVGNSNTTWEDYRKSLDINSLKKLVESVASDTIIPSKNENVADLLETHLDSTQVLPDGTVYKIKRFIEATGDLRIEVYPKDHRPEHFHIISKQRGINARFDINTLELISTKKGQVRESDVKKIQNLFKSRPDVLEKLRSEYERIS